MTTRLIGAVIALAMAILTGSVPLHARERLTYAQGLKACAEWCEKHNNTSGSKNKCVINCDAYWAKNGSDMSPK